MKSRNLRCKAKTRKGVLLWLSAFNPFMWSESLCHDCSIVAVHVHRHTGAITHYETVAGAMIRNEIELLVLAA